MAARLGALGDHRIGAEVAQAHRLGHGRRRGDHPDFGVAQRLDRRRLGQAEDEAGDRRADLEQRLEPGLVEGDRRNLGLGRLAQAPVRVQRRDPLARGRRLGLADLGRRVAEEVDVEGRVGGRAHRRGLGSQLVRVEHRRAEGAEAARRAHRRRQLRRRGAGHRRLQHRLGDSERRRDRGRGEHVLIMRPGPQRRRGPGGPRRSTSRECVPWRLPRCREEVVGGRSRSRTVLEIVGPVSSGPGAATTDPWAGRATLAVWACSPLGGGRYMLARGETRARRTGRRERSQGCRDRSAGGGRRLPWPRWRSPDWRCPRRPRPRSRARSESPATSSPTACDSAARAPREAPRPPSTAFRSTSTSPSRRSPRRGPTATTR